MSNNDIFVGTVSFVVAVISAIIVFGTYDSFQDYVDLIEEQAGDPHTRKVNADAAYSYNSMLTMEKLYTIAEIGAVLGIISAGMNLVVIYSDEYE